MVGGRTRFQVGVRLGSWGVAAAFVALACGGRTSMLDADAFLEPGETTGGASAGSGHDTSGSAHGGTSQGGSVNLPSAGTLNTPLPAGGTGTTPAPGPLSEVCQTYCKGYATKCPQEFEPGQDCIATCLNELGRATSPCQKTGITALRCLTPFFNNAKLTCDQAIGNGLNKCGTQVKAFKACSGEDDGPTPDPNPTDPGPQPNPEPACPFTGEAGPGYCKTTYSCPAGPTTVSCQLSNLNMSYTCQCYQPGGATPVFNVGAGVSDPCAAIAPTCGVPVPL